MTQYERLRKAMRKRRIFDKDQEVVYSYGWEDALAAAPASPASEERLRELSLALATHLLAVHPPDWQYSEIQERAKAILAAAPSPVAHRWDAAKQQAEEGL
jgi:hypothetical protein